MNLFKRSLAKLQSIVIAGLMLMPIHAPIGAAAFVATTTLTATPSEARAGYRACVNTRDRKFYVQAKHLRHCDGTGPRARGYARWTCESLDNYLTARGFRSLDPRGYCHTVTARKHLTGRFQIRTW